jgi:hypothetical protein
VAVVDCANALPDANNDTAINETANLFFITSFSSSYGSANRRQEDLFRAQRMFHAFAR